MSKHKCRNTDFARMRRIMARLEHQLAVEKEERQKAKQDRRAENQRNTDVADTQ